MNCATLIISAWIPVARGPLPIQNDYGALVIVILIALPIVALIIGAQAFDTHRRRERTAAMRTAANDLGWKFDENRFSQSRIMEGFHVGAIGRSPSVTNLIFGESDGIAVKVFDFTHVIGGGKSSRTVRQTVVELPRAGENRSSFFLRPERSWWERPLFEAYRDFDFENFPEFSMRYQLSGNDEDAVRELFTPKVLEFFEQQDRLFAEGSGGRLIYYREGISVEPEQIRAFVEEALRCLRLLEDSGK